MSRLQNCVFVSLCLLVSLCGCGTAVQRNGTEQLLLSDSVDRTVDQLDFSPLAGRRVFLDTTYMQTFKGNNIHVNSDYIVSALRQKLTTTGCQLEPTRTEADYVLEARIGALGTDSMEVTYGIPSSNSGLGAAATALSGAPSVISIPEVSVGKRNGAIGVSKVVVFAYHRESGVPVWQSGAAVSRSDAKDSWFLGVGPWTRGSVYDGVMLAGSRLHLPFEKGNRPRTAPLAIGSKHNYVHPAVLEKQLADAKENEKALKEQEKIQQASHQQAAVESPAVPSSPETAASTETAALIAPAPVADPVAGNASPAAGNASPANQGSTAGTATLPPLVPPEH